MLLEERVEYIKNNNNGNTCIENSSSPFVLRSYSRWSPLKDGVTLAWNDLSCYAKINQHGSSSSYKKIICGVSGAVKAGSLVALMGASGAGKSTLMAALAHKCSGDIVVEGDILINGRPVGDYMKYLSGYMYQEDAFIGSLTVWEHMNIMARMKFDRRLTPTERKDKILDILLQLDLLKCLNSKIGSGNEQKTLSGGERKRLAFATELLTDPPILFCDEPTTGLDSYSAQKLITIMNSMAARGKTIICTIHQPNSQIFSMFNQIILLAEGKIAFMGQSKGAMEFLQTLGFYCPNNYNPADFLIKTLAIVPGSEGACKQNIKQICNNFHVSDYAKEVDAMVQYEFHMGSAAENFEVDIRRHKLKEPRVCTKLLCLIYRFFIDILRNPSLQLMRILQKIGVAIMIGLCYLDTNALTQYGVQSIQGALFLIVTENTFLPMYAALAIFPQDVPMFLREYKSGLYSVTQFYVSKIISMLPGLLIEAFLFVSILYWMTGLRPTIDAFAATVFCSILTINVSTACGIFFSNVFGAVDIAMAWLVPIDFVLLISSGLFIKLSTLSTVFSVTKYASWLMYSTEALMIVQWDGIQNITCAGDNLPCIRSGQDVLNKYGFDADHLYRNIFNIIYLTIIFYLLGFFFLYRRAIRALDDTDRRKSETGLSLG